jgi:hypothetical protein
MEGCHLVADEHTSLKTRGLTLNNLSHTGPIANRLDKNKTIYTYQIIIYNIIMMRSSLLKAGRIVRILGSGFWQIFVLR